jgi:hypothetical protein
VALNLQELTKTDLLLASDSDLQVIFDHISSGGTLKDICEMWKINYSIILNKLRNSKELSQKLDQAEQNRDLYFKDVIINEYKNIATTNIKNIYTDKGVMLDVQDMPDNVTSAIKEITKSSDKDDIETINIKFHDKVKSLETLGKQIGMFVEKKEIKATFTLEHAATRAVERAAAKKAARLLTDE